MTFFWLSIKTMVSVVAAIGGLYIFFIMYQSTGLSHPKPWVILAISMFLAVAPWVFFEQKKSRAFALTTLFMGIGTLFFALGVPYMPKDCSIYATPKGRSGCTFFNWVYSLGGSNLVAVFFIAMGLIFLLGSYFLYKQYAKNA
jgi:hypothetical protein